MIGHGHSILFEYDTLRGHAWAELKHAMHSTTSAPVSVLYVLLAVVMRIFELTHCCLVLRLTGKMADIE